MNFQIASHLSSIFLFCCIHQCSCVLAKRKLEKQGICGFGAAGSTSSRSEWPCMRKSNLLLRKKSTKEAKPEPIVINVNFSYR